MRTWHAPLLSIIIPSRTHEDAKLQRLLHTLHQQTFHDFEVLVETKGNSEEAKAMAALSATGELIGFFCTDNDLRDRNFLKTMVAYAQQPNVDGAYTAQYDYVLSDHALSRYFALLGTNDPLCWWLGKADRWSYLERPQTLARSFRPMERLPSLGDNGFFLKRSVLRRSRFTPDTFGSCMCLCEDLRRLGHSTYWIVAEQKLWHRTGEDFLGYFRRRYHYVKTLYCEKRSMRRWHMVETPQDYLSVLTFTLASLLWLPHLWLAFRGYRRVKDWSWFLHPVVCYVLTLVYIWAWTVHFSALLSRHLIGRRS